MDSGEEFDEERIQRLIDSEMRVKKWWVERAIATSWRELQTSDLTVMMSKLVMWSPKDRWAALMTEWRGKHGWFKGGWWIHQVKPRRKKQVEMIREGEVPVDRGK